MHPVTAADAEVGAPRDRPSSARLPIQIQTELTAAAALTKSLTTDSQ